MFAFQTAAADGDQQPTRPAPVMGSPATHRNGSLQSRKNETPTGILEDQSDGDGGEDQGSIRPGMACGEAGSCKQIGKVWSVTEQI